MGIESVQRQFDEVVSVDIYQLRDSLEKNAAEIRAIDLVLKNITENLQANVKTRSHIPSTACILFTSQTT